MSDALDALAPTAQPAPAPAAPPACPRPVNRLRLPLLSLTLPRLPRSSPRRPQASISISSPGPSAINLPTSTKPTSPSCCARAEYERRAELERQNDPAYQHLERRNQAFEQLVHDRYGREVAQALPMLPQVAEYLHAQRADAAQADMVGALEEIGITFDTSKEALDLRQEWEDLLTDRINAHPRYIERYNLGSPAERRDLIRELVGREERRINPVLLKQNAATLRDAAARKAMQPRAGRGGAATPQIRREVPDEHGPGPPSSRKSRER